VKKHLSFKLEKTFKVNVVQEYFPKTAFISIIVGKIFKAIH
jgi:hypothetical protein